MTDNEVLLSLSNMLDPIKGDILDIKSDVSEIKSDMSKMKSEMSEMNTRLKKVVAEHSRKLQVIS